LSTIRLIEEDGYLGAAHFIAPSSLSNQRENYEKITKTMKFSPSILAAVALCATVTTAFTVGPQYRALSAQKTQQQSVVSRQSNDKMGSTLLKMDTNAFAESEIANNDVVVFAKSYCPHCAATKELFTSMGVDFVVHDLDKMGDDGPALQLSLFNKTNQKTVPNVFVKGQHIGGNDDTQAAAKEGKLQEMLGIKV
jgi:glutaredoxin 3